MSIKVSEYRPGFIDISNPLNETIVNHKNDIINIAWIQDKAIRMGNSPKIHQNFVKIDNHIVAILQVT